MASVKFSALVSDIRGKIGGNIFARNGSGAYARSFAMPINPNTSKQQAVRNKFANLISSWKNLTKAQQQLWEDMAPQYPYSNRLGETSQYTGQQLYNKLNMNLEIVGQATLSAPLVPQTFSPISMTSMTMELTAGVLTTGTVELSVEGAPSESVIIEVTTALSGGITKPAKGLFKQVLINNDADAQTDYDITAAYIALFGSPEVGATIFTRAFLINENTGQRMNIGQTSTIVTTV